MTSPSVTVREFYASLTLVWLYLAFLAIDGLRQSHDWNDYLQPAGAVLILAFYAFAWRRHDTASTAMADSPHR